MFLFFYAFQSFFLLLHVYIISMLYIVAILSLVLVRETNKMIDPHVILAMPFNFILSSSHLYYRNTQFLLWQASSGSALRSFFLIMPCSSLII